MIKALSLGCIVTIGSLGVFIYSFYETSRRSLTKKHFIKIPIRYLSILKGPHIEVEIEKQKFYFLIDSGSDTQLSFQSKAIQKIQNKHFIGNSTNYNFKGIKYNSEIYEIETFKIGESLISYKTKISTDHDEAIRKANNWNKEPSLSSWVWGKIDSWMSHGKIGNGFFKNFVCYFDFPDETFCIAKDLGSLMKEGGYSLEPFISTSIEVAPFGPIVKMETKWGSKAFLLDTGSTRSLIQQKSLLDEEETKSDLFLENFHLGSCCFTSCYISPLFSGIDGILGVDFFKERVVCIDYLQKKAYIYHIPLATRLCTKSSYSRLKFSTQETMGVHLTKYQESLIPAYFAAD
ncbi:MAG: hypothetical protein A3D96_07130 [Chlamydiae bacterium RIFCSPHIGHO2_12_FULL_44_59]|nr:MAG: hypothetical protein A2796_06140 [Chlamydiae bacterium RIFCSPHIGHO2_01_FULL_44_39]OGN59212.1 MAG: hypothetical protein A3C42_04610 [Chlamydiae bacterium RIFCSPHIGHO2_02_FULL_45_9]OGN59455.1 MAG: hypothetical protein A3D96_07130 [Chlamydiae bacterium RIFCSPHIGHO2_12_FULL_44_59]OGN67208.1 MAG: hypothetical protein A2978_03515 [Chlamydiae bacterium RIFCSPLOWO2_01_FULL_44_52]OGN67405.1 MAG: hypothetical protein A3I67_01085 [Chlamydiae bacterium RIFCSPLOWO2_02_FULL_45_22]OGN69137.1 MAG: hyp